MTYRTGKDFQYGRRAVEHALHRIGVLPDAALLESVQKLVVGR
jgi:hypothetical protein